VSSELVVRRTCRPRRNSFSTAAPSHWPSKWHGKQFKCWACGAGDAPPQNKLSMGGSVSDKSKRARCKKDVPPQKKLIIGGCPLPLTLQMAGGTIQCWLPVGRGVRRPRRNSEWVVLSQTRPIFIPVRAETRSRPAREQRARCKKDVQPQKKLLISGCPLPLTQQMAWETIQMSCSCRGEGGCVAPEETQNGRFCRRPEQYYTRAGRDQV